MDSTERTNQSGLGWTSDFVSALLTVVMILAGAGFLAAFLGLVMSYAGVNLLGDQATNLLLPGMFVVWFPTVLVTYRMTRFGNRNDLWKIALSGCPPWMRVTLWTTCGFGILNFLYFVAFGGGKYKQGPSIQFAGGHLLIFYGVAFCVMYSALHSQKLLISQHCSNGHIVSPTDEFCPKCGVSLREPHGDASGA